MTGRVRPVDIGLPVHHLYFDIIQEGYREFASPKPVATGVCDCCFDPQKWVILLRPEVHAIRLESLRSWFAASYERGGVSHATWRYLLPRILEALAAGAWLDAAGLEASLSRAETGNPDRWTPRQWRVLERFRRLYISQCLDGGRHRLDDVICMFRLGGWPLDDLLTQVAEASAQSLVKRLWRDWCADIAPGRESIWQTSFWPDHDRTLVADFYCHDRILDPVTEVALSGEVPSQISRMAIRVVHAIEQARNIRSRA